MLALCLPLLFVVPAPLLTPAQDTDPAPRAVFAPPLRLVTPAGPMGSNRLFPSPTLHDLDGDGVAELILGDLPGVLTVSRRESADGAPTWSDPQPLPAAGGKDLRFNNW